MTQAIESELEWVAPGPGPWQQDRAHQPHPTTLAMRDTFVAGFNRGFQETFARYGALLDTLRMAVVNGFTYHQPVPFDAPGPDGPKTPDEIGAEFMRRVEVAGRAFATKLWRDDLALWDETCKPTAIARHRELGDVDFASLDTDALVAHLHAVAAHVEAMAYQHHRFNVAALLPIGDLALHVAQWTHRDPRSVLAVLDGYSPVSAVASDELQPTLDALRDDAEARALLSGSAPADDRLAELRRRVPPLDEYLRYAGPRLVEGFDVVAPTMLERPELVLGRLAAALESDPSAARRRADEFAAALREHVPEEHRAEFDEMLADARSLYRLRDERGLYSDITAVGLLRRAMLEVGRRLVAAGVSAQPEDALEATLEELEALLRGGEGPAGEELAARRDARHTRAEAGAPRFLGDPPSPPPPADQLPPPLARLMSAIGFAIEGVLGEMEAPSGDDRTIVGIPVSAGVCEGRARLVRTIDDLSELEDGDVLVTPSTGEAFNAMLHLVSAIVTDHGSYASHAGIVSREMGIPAVAGTVNGTTRIPDGARVRVDGSAGEVTILE